MRPTVHTQCSAPDSEPATIYLRDYCAPPSLHSPGSTTSLFFTALQK